MFVYPIKTLQTYIKHIEIRTNNINNFLSSKYPKTDIHRKLNFYDTYTIFIASYSVLYICLLFDRTKPTQPSRPKPALYNQK